MHVVGREVVGSLVGGEAADVAVAGWGLGAVAEVGRFVEEEGDHKERGGTKEGYEEEDPGC